MTTNTPGAADQAHQQQAAELQGDDGATDKNRMLPTIQKEDAGADDTAPPSPLPIADITDDDAILTLLRPSAQCDPTQLSGTHLAYIGDCVYELFVRSKVVWPPKTTTALQERAVSLVNADYQARLLAKLKEEYPLTPAERNVLSRGRNATTKRGSQNRNGGGYPATTYQDSTALEALLGYVYMSHDDPARLYSLLAWLRANVE